jgi:hypothetical protein
MPPPLFHCDDHVCVGRHPAERTASTPPCEGVAILLCPQIIRSAVMPIMEAREKTEGLPLLEDAPGTSGIAHFLFSMNNFSFLLSSRIRFLTKISYCFNAYRTR